MSSLTPPSRSDALPLTGAEVEVRRRIAADGPMTFAEFMALALYWPDGGYYVSRSPFGAGGDFYTAPLTHPVFGALVQRQLEQMWHVAGSPERWWVAEAGAGAGRLAADVSLASAGQFSRALRYVAVDQATAIGGSGVSWVRSDGLPLRGMRGVVQANELLDALPVHRVTVADGALRELRVGVAGDGGFEDVLATPTAGVVERLAALGARLGEGHRAEVCLALDDWFSHAGRAMASGYLLLFDYGHEATAYYDASRNKGTLRTYHQHTLGMNPYAHVGRQDISVHVELTSVRRAAEAVGFALAGQTTQAEFLQALGFDAYRADIAARRDVGAPVRGANLRALDTLVDPEGMGGFSVLAFAKGVPAGGLAGFAGDSPQLSVSAPLASASHMPLGGGMQEAVEMPTWDELLK